MKLVPDNGKRIPAKQSHFAVVDQYRNRSMNPIYRKVEAKVTVASLANSSMAAALRSLLLTTHGAVAAFLANVLPRSPLLWDVA